MTLEEAIKYSEGLKAGIDKDEMPKHYKAVQLGIEALKCLHVLRLISTNEANHLLPGETEK